VVKVGEILGRWPSNLLLDEESAKMLDEQSGELKSGNIGKVTTPSKNQIYGGRAIANVNSYEANEGGASRFFYMAKADRFEREAGLVGNIECSRCKKLVEEGQWPVHEGDHIYNDHPTVKPIELMRYLVRLVTPRNGLCLDPFVGSGTTLIADMFEGVNGVGIEKDAEKKGTIFYRLEYWRPIAEKRKTEEAQERKDQSHRIAETVRTLDLFESEEIEEDEQQLGDGKVNGDTSKVH
jgi:site-specific DNA-methyltransferase (adenine-specific)